MKRMSILLSQHPALLHLLSSIHLQDSALAESGSIATYMAFLRSWREFGCFVSSDQCSQHIRCSALRSEPERPSQGPFPANPAFRAKKECTSLRYHARLFNKGCRGACKSIKEALSEAVFSARDMSICNRPRVLCEEEHGKSAQEMVERSCFTIYEDCRESFADVDESEPVPATSANDMSAKPAEPSSPCPTNSTQANTDFFRNGVGTQANMDFFRNRVSAQANMDFFSKGVGTQANMDFFRNRVSTQANTDFFKNPVIVAAETAKTTPKPAASNSWEGDWEADAWDNAPGLVDITISTIEEDHFFDEGRDEERDEQRDQYVDLSRLILQLLILAHWEVQRIGWKESIHSMGIWYVRTANWLESVCIPEKVLRAGRRWGFL